MKHLFFLTILFFSSHSIAQNELTTLPVNHKTCRAVVIIFDNVINGGMSNDADIAGQLSF